jgi:hypothetical protein
MGATSVTGVGLGAADGSNKGSEHMTLATNKLIGPRVVVADEITLDGGGDKVIKLPLLPGVAGDYVVVLGDSNAAAATAVAAALTIGGGVTTITFKGTAAQTVAYAVIKKGMSI